VLVGPLWEVAASSQAGVTFPSAVAVDVVERVAGAPTTAFAAIEQR
jgi:hypothetical protein